jgi:cation-transporting P-type ATPase 13A2
MGVVFNKLREILTTEEFLVKFLDLITICVPPSLAAAMTVGISVSVVRLKKGKINCIDPERMILVG